MAIHKYALQVKWTGNTGSGTQSYKAYKRDFSIQGPNKTEISGSADPAYLGDPTRWNPEDLIVASASACHKLWYLHLCSTHKINVLDYIDHATGYMDDNPTDRKAHMTHILLAPTVVIQKGHNKYLANKLHEEAHHECMIANSVNFPIHCEATILFEDETQQ
nr:OsmC family protein [Acinetobacter sp. Marseille-Q1620]